MKELYNVLFNDHGIKIYWLLYFDIL